MSYGALKGQSHLRIDRSLGTCKYPSSHKNSIKKIH
uniref:Uncharacterized protein n=1 Tax=Anguilla anguilla TaxID=7936 RepID=A0A0E9XJZ6_ANGAN